MTVLTLNRRGYDISLCHLNLDRADIVLVSYTYFSGPQIVGQGKAAHCFYVRANSEITKKLVDAGWRGWEHNGKEGPYITFYGTEKAEENTRKKLQDLFPGIEFKTPSEISKKERDGAA